MMDFGSGRIRKIRWYFADENASTNPHINAFNSLNWLPKEERTPQGLGEVPGASRPWRNGAPPGALPPGTGKPCGKAEWWHTGVPLDQPDLIFGTNRVARCCGGTAIMQLRIELRKTLPGWVPYPPGPFNGVVPIRSSKAIQIAAVIQHRRVNLLAGKQIRQGVTTYLQPSIRSAKRVEVIYHFQSFVSVPINASKRVEMLETVVYPADTDLVALVRIDMTAVFMTVVLPGITISTRIDMTIL